MSDENERAQSDGRKKEPLFGDIDTSNYVGLLIRLNFIALLPLFVGILLLWLPYQLYKVMGMSAVLFTLPKPPIGISALLYLAIVILSMAIHELIHALVIKLAGFHPIVAIQSGFLVAGITEGEYLPRKTYLAVTLAPLVIMTILGGCLLPLLPKPLAEPLLVALLLNFPASIGDLYVARRVYNYPSTTTFASDGEHIYAYLD